MLKKIVLWLVGIVAVVGLVFALGPREPVDETITFQAASLGADLDSYLEDREKGFADITPGAQKQIVWLDPSSKQKTPLSIVYIHGFSATLEEVRPLPDIVARDMAANLYYTRLKGHGRGGDAMAEASVNDWYNDVAEALEIGRSIGEKVIVISTSTGGTLASWATAKAALMADVAGTVLISPNYAVRAEGSEMLSLPWARQILPMIFGHERSWEPRNEEQGKWWTTRYPNVALLPMQASVDHAKTLDFESFSIPALFVFHPRDGVVNHDVTKSIADRWGKKSGTKVAIEEVAESDDTYNHVIAGRILSPGNTEPLAQKIINWIRSL